MSRGADFGRWGAYVITSGQHVALAEAACAAGARILQYRDKQASGADRLETARAIRAITRASGCLFIVNDHLKLALEVGADGVHLGQADLALDRARGQTPAEFIIGTSTHSLEQARAAEAGGADYIGVGPVFGTPTKPDYPPIGLQTLEQVVAQAGIPCVAIGGIDLDKLRAIRAAGATNVAMVRGYQGETARAVSRVNEILLGGEGALSPPSG